MNRYFLQALILLLLCPAPGVRATSGHGDEFKVEKHFDEASKTHFFLTRINHKDGGGNLIKLRHAHSNRAEGETVTDFARRTGATLAFNASTQIKDPSGIRKPTGVQIVDGVILQDLLRNAYTLGVKADNTLATYPPGTNASSMLEDGSIDALAGFIPLIENYEPVSEELFELRPNFKQKHPRQIIAQFENSDLLFLSCGGRGFDGEGMTAMDVIRILKKKGVRLAFMLDGGGSVSTVVNGRRITKKIDKKGTEERPRPNFLYIQLEQR